MTTSPGAGTSGDEVGRRSFSTSFRGFDQSEVRTYLEVVAEEFNALRAKIGTLEDALEQATRPTEEAPLDAAALTRLVGEETARVLHAAQEAADDMRARAEEGAARALTEAHEEAARIRGAAEGVLAERTAEAEQIAAAIRAGSEEKAAQLTKDAKAEAERTIKQAVDEGRDMVGQAKAARERVLADLARRRRSGLGQIEQLRAGRDRLAVTLASVRAEVDRMTADLEAADEVARLAAEGATRPSGRTEETTEVPEVAAVDLPTEPAVNDAPTEPAVPDPLPEPVAPVPVAPEPVVVESAEAAVEAEPEHAAVDGPLLVTTPTEPAPDPADVIAEAVLAEESLISAPHRKPKRSKGAPTPIAVPREVYTHDGVPPAFLPAAAVGLDAEADADPPGKVDELFARIRDHSDVPAPTTKPKRKRSNRPADADAVPAARSGVESEDASLEAPRSDAHETYLQRRDVLVEVVHATTVRGLRRSLADDQNAALEKFRTIRAETVDIESLLGLESGQIEAWSRRAASGLSEGAAAGAQLATGADAPAADAPAVPAELVRPIADALATELVIPLRAKLAVVLESVGGDRGSDTVDRINSVCREWRSRIDRGAGDAVTAAVSAGFSVAVAAGTPVMWVVEDVDGPCPDCDDNALAGAMPIGEAFPTGQTAPPAHPGCRCVLSRATT